MDMTTDTEYFVELTTTKGETEFYGFYFPLGFFFYLFL